MQKKFKESLYRSSNINSKNVETSSGFFFNGELSNHRKSEAIIKEIECTYPLKDLNSNKPPGTEGLPAELYRFFWPDICQDLIPSYNYTFEHATISISQRNGIILLIPNKDKHETIPKALFTSKP